MAVTPTPVFVQLPKVGLQQILPADVSANKTVVTPGANGSKVVSLNCTNDDTVARVVRLSIVRSAVSYFVGAATIPVNAGVDGLIPSASMLSLANIPSLAIDNDGQPYLFLQTGDVLVVNCTTTMAAGKTLSFSATYGDF